MARRSPLFAPALACVVATSSLALAGCAPADPDSDELDAWMTAAAERDLSGDLAVITGQVDTGSDFVDGEGTHVDFETPVQVTGVEFSCSGDGSMRFSLSASGEDSASGFETDALACADSPHLVRATEVLPGVKGILNITVDAAESDSRSAWTAVITGTDPGPVDE